MDKNNVQALFGLEKTKKWQMVNKCNIVNWGGKWTTKALEKTMDVVERGTSLRKANKTLNIFLTSLSNHMNGKLIWYKKNSKSISVRKM
jgi:hypothetical protein